MSNKSILIMILVVVSGLFAFLVLDHNQTPAEQLSNSISEFGEEVRDEIDDATTG